MSLIKVSVLNEANIDKICRICLENKINLFSLFTNIEFDDENVICTSIPDILFKITSESVQTENGLPVLICTECADLIKAAYLFKVKYEESSSILRNYLSSFVKEEKIEADASVTNCDIHDECGESSAEANKPFHERFKKTRRMLRRNKSSNKPLSKKRCLSNRRRTHQQDQETTSAGDETDSFREDNIVHPCPVCTVELPALELRQHAHTHKALKKYLSLSKSEQVTETTRFVAGPPTDRPSFFAQANILHKCPYCNMDYPAQQFRVHIDQHRRQDEFKCDKCERVFRKMNHLNTHRVKHLKEYPYKCNDCSKGFVIKTNYDCHILTHTNSELPHECTYCLKRFSNPEHLNRHQIIHTENVSYSVKYKVCKCHHCLKTFKDRKELKTHVCVPVEQIVNTKYPCKSCNKVFKHSSGLYNHNRIIHKLKGAKILCSVCGNYVSNIYNHMMRHTGEKPYECNQCDKRFIAKPQLRQHLVVHSGLKPYVCSVCAKAFNNLYNLQVHERIHKGDRCHICSICNKGFLEKSYLKKHMNVHKKI